MRTAHEWYLKINSYSNPNEMNDVAREWVEKMINEARKEAIEECAKRATLIDNGVYIVPSDQVDKQSILSLINELK